MYLHFKKRVPEFSSVSVSKFFKSVAAFSLKFTVQTVPYGVVRDDSPY